jgi:integrase
VLKETKRYLAKYPDMKLTKLATQDVLRVIDAQTDAEANKLFTVSRTFFRFCVRRKLLQRSPIEGLQPPHKTIARSRVLTDQELRSIWQACTGVGDHGRLPRSFAAIVCLLMLTGMRRSECAGLEAKFFRGDLCTLPSALCKNGREHCFPIGDFSKRLLAPFVAAAPSGYLFAARGNTDRPFSGWSKTKAALDSASATTDWTLHDLRRTYRTIHARIGTPPHIAERLVNHVSSRSEVEAIYDRFNYLEPMRVAARNFEDFFGKTIMANHAATVG